MAREICGRGSCTKSFHNIAEQERFDARQSMSSDVEELRTEVQDLADEVTALRARLAEVEAQRDGLKDALDLIRSGDYKNAATNCFAAVAVGIANRALAKLEAHDGK